MVDPIFSGLDTPLTSFISELKTPQGRHAGRKFKVLDWQYQFAWGAFCTDISEVYLTIARGNGKTTFLAGVALAAVAHDGPLMQPNAETLIVASSLDQARVLFNHVLAMGRPEHLKSRRQFKIRDNQQQCQITNVDSGATVRCLGSDSKRAHGRAPVLVLADEPAQWVNGGDALFAALRTSLGKIPNSRLVALGTKSAVPEHWFTRRLENPSDGNYVQAHFSSDIEKYMDREQWLEANPSLDHLPDLEKLIAKECVDAEKDTGLLAQFQSLRLNGGVSEVENRDMLIDPSTWKECLTDEPPPREGKPVWGVDLGGSAAMSAVASCWPNGRLETLAMFGKEPDLVRRAVRDNVGDLYEIARREGDLLVSAERIPDVLAMFKKAEVRWGGMPAAIIADRWRVADLKDALEKDPRWFQVPLILRGQGFKDGSSAVRAWRKATASRKLKVVAPARLLTRALAEAVTVSDPAGNEKLAKNTEGGRRKRARDDLAAASLLAVEYGIREEQAEESQGHGGYGGLV